MGTYKISMAIWLSLFIYLLGQSRISNATSLQRNTKNVPKDDLLLEEIVLSSKNNMTKFVGAAAIENPNSSNNEQIVSLIKGTTDLVFPNYNSTQDQSLAQSQTVIVSLNDPKDLENLDHILAFSEYESQKVDIKKDKRKSQEYFNNDQVIPNKQIKTVTETTVLPYVKTYYNVPRGFQSNRNSYQDRYHPTTTVSYQKVSQPFTQTEPNNIVSNTDGSNKKLIIANHKSPKLYQSENDLILEPIHVTRSTYYVPTRKIKIDDKKIQSNVENNINIRPKLRKIKKKVKSLNGQLPTFETTPMSVFNYTISNRIINKHKSSLLDNPLVQPFVSQKINNIIYQNDSSLEINNQPDVKRQKSFLNSKSNDEVNLFKRYSNVIPKPFLYSTKHAGNVVEKVLTTTINPVTSKNIIGIEESFLANNSKVKPILNYSDKINHLNDNQEIGYKYRKESTTIKPKENYDNLEKNIDDVSSSKINITNKKKLINNDNNVEQFVNNPQRRNDEISEPVTLKYTDTNNDTDDYTESYKFPETSENEQSYYDDYDDNKDVNHKQDLQSYKEDENYENTDNDNNYDETKQEENENHSEENYEEKNNLHGYDQDEDSSHNYKVEEKSNDSGGSGGGGSGSGDKKFTKGGEVEKKEEHYDKHGKKEEKGYKSLHEHDKGEKGHHDKVRHSKEYDEKKGEKKEHDENGKYNEDYYKEEEGKKEAKFNEKGEHKKGHSTKGEHSVHKKDEYEKKTEFFDEFNEDGDSEKDGEYYSEHEAEKGGKEKSGHYNEADDKGKHGKMKKYEEGEYYDENKGKDSKEGQDSHYDHEQKYMKKGAHESGKIWMMDNGDNGGDSSSGGGDKKDTADDKHSR